MNTADLQEIFKASLNELTLPEVSLAPRQKAMAAFARQGFPTRKDEDWRYTDLKPILRGDFDPRPSAWNESRRPQVLDQLADLELDPEAPRLVFVDGQRLTDARLSAIPPGVDIYDQDQAWDRIGALQTHEQFRSYPLSALNTAFASSCTLIRVGANIDVDETLHLIFLGGASADRAAQARTLIDLGRGSRLRVVQHFASRDGAGWTNSVTQITQAAGSELTLYRLQEHGDEHIHTELSHARLARDARVNLGYVDLGGRLVRNDLTIDLAEPGAACDIFGVFLAAQGQHVDNHTRIDHSAPHTTSNEAFRGIVGDRGRGVFNGKVVVHRGAQGTDAQQSSDNLLLSERGEVDTKPELEIYTDDVKCAHGATVGELDTEQLFYLRSRGIDEKTARGLLIFAFANDLLRRIDIPELRKRVVSAVAGNLPDFDNWGGLI